MNKKTNESSIFILYIFAAAVTVCLFFGAIIADRPESQDNITDFSDCWYADEDMSVSVFPEEPADSDKVSYYAVVPDCVEDGFCLFFRMKNGTLRVWLNDELKYSVDPVSGFYGRSPGTQWVSVPLECSDIGKTLRIDFSRGYTDSSCYLSNLSIGPESVLILSTVSGRLVGVITCILLMFTGVVLIIVHIALKIFSKSVYSQDLMYLGCFAIAASSWSLCETKILQIFSVNSGAVHSFCCMSLCLIVFPLFFYFRSDLEGKKKRIITAIAALSIFNFVLNVILHFTGIADFHQTLTVTHITAGISAVCVVYANYERIFKNKNRKSTDIAAGIGMIIFAATAVIDVIRYRSFNVEDTSLFTRIGLLIYVFTLGICSLSYIIEMVKKGMTADFIGRLAYEDGLTGLGNRTAYNEYLGEIAGTPAVIFAFDINNLKYVNDNFGHQEGDNLIKLGADLIHSVFGEIGRCYRIGGDEFVCITSESVDAEKLKNEFYAAQKRINDKGNRNFPLVIAMGYETYDGGDNLSEALNSADHKMYLRKSELKKAAPSPARI